MRAKTISTFLHALALVAMLGVLAPRAAMAQDEGGRFTLTTEVHWGAAVLPAGDYRFSMDSFAFPTKLYIFKESNPAAGYMVLPQTWDRIPATSNEDQLVLNRENGGLYVKELHLTADGYMLGFAVPKAHN